MTRDYRDIAGGLLLVICGTAFALYTMGRYDMGNLRQMGPGMMPAAMGFVLAALGAFMIVPALRRGGKMPEIRVRSPLFVLLGVAAFAVLIRSMGLIPAILAITIISSFAEERVRPLSMALLSVALCVIAWLVFTVGLGLPIRMFIWSF